MQFFDQYHARQLEVALDVCLCCVRILCLTQMFRGDSIRTCISGCCLDICKTLYVNPVALIIG